MYKDVARTDLLELFADDESSVKLDELPANAQSVEVKRAKFGNRFRTCDAASQDIVLAAWAYRVASRRSVFEVGLFLCADVSRFEPDSGVRVGLLLILQQAYRLTGSMRISFVGQSQNRGPVGRQGFEPEVPRSIREYAAKYGVLLDGENEISDEEGRTLFVRINLEPEEYDRIVSLGLDPVMVAFQVLRRTWTESEMHHILCELDHPSLVLTGEILAYPEYYGTMYEFIRSKMSFAVFLEYARHCIGSQIAERLMDHQSFGGSIRLTWTSLSTAIAQSTLPLVVECYGGDLLFPHLELPILLCPFEKEEYLYFGLDFVVESLRKSKRGMPGVVICTYDFHAIPREFRDSLVALVAGFGWGILVTRITAGRVDLELYEKLKRARNFLVELDDVSGM